jgi:hypothetical protein
MSALVIHDHDSSLLHFIQLLEQMSLMEVRYLNLFLFHHVIKGDFARIVQSVELIGYYVISH